MSTCHTLYSEPRSKMWHNGEGRAERSVRISVGYEPRAKQGSICGDVRGELAWTREAFDIEVNMPNSMLIYHLVIWEGATTNRVNSQRTLC